MEDMKELLTQPNQVLGMKLLGAMIWCWGYICTVALSLVPVQLWLLLLVCIQCLGTFPCMQRVAHKNWLWANIPCVGPSSKLAYFPKCICVGTSVLCGFFVLIFQGQLVPSSLKYWCPATKLEWSPNQEWHPGWDADSAPTVPCVAWDIFRKYQLF